MWPEIRQLIKNLRTDPHRPQRLVSSGRAMPFARATRASRAQAIEESLTELFAFYADDAWSA
jgi:hypothetical protein